MDGVGLRCGVPLVAALVLLGSLASPARANTPRMRTIGNLGGVPVSDFVRYLVTDDNDPASARLTIYDSHLRRSRTVNMPNCAPSGATSGTALLVCVRPATTANLLMELATGSVRDIVHGAGSPPAPYEEIGRQWLRNRGSDPNCSNPDQGCPVDTYLNWHTGAFRQFRPNPGDLSTDSYDLNRATLGGMPPPPRYSYSGAKLTFKPSSHSQRLTLSRCRVQCEQIHDEGGVVIWEENGRRATVYAYVVRTRRRLAWSFPKDEGDFNIYATFDEVIVSRPITDTNLVTKHRITAAPWH